MTRVRILALELGIAVIRIKEYKLVIPYAATPVIHVVSHINERQSLLEAVYPRG
jgi:hypothetical protein